MFCNYYDAKFAFPFSFDFKENEINWIKMFIYIYLNFLVWQISDLLCGIVDEWRDNHLLYFYTNIYCHYAEHTDEHHLEDLKVAGHRLQVADSKLQIGSFLWFWLWFLCYDQWSVSQSLLK
jgi:hypothetical protein